MSEPTTFKAGDKAWNRELEEFTILAITNNGSGADLGQGRAELLVDLFPSYEAARAQRFIGDADDFTFIEPTWPVLGQCYTRQEISDKLGGSIQSYLPTVDERVVCGCFNRRENPEAPKEILFGNAGASPDINRCADLVFAQGQKGQEIPVFVKVSTNNWKYIGDFLCVGITRDPRIVDLKKKQHPDRGEFHGLLRFEPVSEVAEI